MVGLLGGLEKVVGVVGVNCIRAGFFLCEIHPSPCKQNAGLTSFGVLKTSFSILKTSFTLSEKQFLSFF